MKKKLLIILAVLIVLYLIGKGCSSSPATPNQNTTPENTTQETSKDNAITLPENKFDATVAAPGTNLIFSYPSKGFYQLGANVKTFQPGDPKEYGNILSIQPAQSYQEEKGSEFVTVVVALDDLPSQEKNLKEMVEKRSFNGLEDDYVKDNGHYETINGREFFLYRVDEAIIIWRALTLHNNQVITITMMYKLAGEAESKAAFEHNDNLFAEVLQHITYK